MRITVDTNIVFSAILNSQSVIGDLLLNSNDLFTFFTVRFLHDEIENHWNKLKKNSGLNDKNLRLAQEVVYNRIHFIDEQLIPEGPKKKAFELVNDVDINDIAF